MREIDDPFAKMYEDRARERSPSVTSQCFRRSIKRNRYSLKKFVRYCYDTATKEAVAKA